MNLEINPEEVLTWETKKLWNTLKTLEYNPENEIKKETIEKIKNGIKIKCTIWYLTEEWYEIHPSSKKVTIMGYGKFLLKDFMTEKEERDNLMRKTIIELIDEEGIIEGRV